MSIGKFSDVFDGNGTRQETRAPGVFGSEVALRSGMEALRPRGVLVQLGLGGDVTIPQSTVVAK